MIRYHQMSWKLRLACAGCFLLLISPEHRSQGQQPAQEQEPGTSAAEPETPPPATPDDPQQAATNDAVVALERGPIHEAFAEPVTLDSQGGIVVQQQPPEPVPELPPETRPQGDNVEWIPGYWAWSDQSDDFIWISGIWRDIPPGQQWVPGYWTDTSEGYQWTRGFWTSQETDELVYLPPPPESLETEPTSPRPGPDHFWIPGSWRWQDNQYYWRGGFWHPAQENWVWIPAHYCYTPRGYVFLSGYWDYPLQSRGLLFAPVHFRRPIYTTSGYYYTPNSWIDVATLTVGLFVAPRYGHYYYGNYYGSQFASGGIYPWYQYHNRPFGYDPLFVYASWRNGGRDSDWFNNLQAEYRRRGSQAPDARRPIEGDRPADGRDRPPRDRDTEQIQFVHKLQELRENRGENLTRINETEQRATVERARTRFGELRNLRAESESQQRRDAASRRDRPEDRQPGADRPSPDRSDRPQSERPPSDRPQTDRPQTDRPQTDQPRPDQRRSNRPDLGQPGANRPQGDRPQQTRPAGPINGRFQFPQRNRGSVPGANRVPGADGSPQQRGRAVPPQIPQRPGNAPQPRGGAGPNQSRPDAGARSIPQNRGAARGSRKAPSPRGASGGNRENRDN